MKKTIAMLVTGCLLVALAACGPTMASSEVSSSSGSFSASVAETEEPESSLASETSQPVPGSILSFDTTGTIQETVLYEENGVKITATGLEYSLDQVTVVLTIENSSAQDLSFSSGTLGYSCNAVNGIMVDDGYLNCDVAAGKSANETVTFAVHQLMLCGIDRVASLQLGFTITDPDYNSVYITPVVLQTSLAEGYQQPEDSIRAAVQKEALQSMLGFTVPFFQVETLYDQSGVQVQSAGLMKNSSGEQMLLLEVVNSGEQPVYFVTSDLAFNGMAVYSYNWSSDVILSGARRMVYLNVENVFDKNFWAAYGLESLTLVSMNVTLKDLDGNPLVENTPLAVQLSDTEPAVDTQGVEVYNEGGIRVISKELVEDEMGDLSALLLVENTSGQTITAGVGYDSLSIGGVMNDFSCSERTILDGGRAALVIGLRDLEENGIASAEDITDLEFQLQIRSEASYDTFAEPKVTLTFAGGIAA
jgi:hypothetical protein